MNPSRERSDAALLAIVEKLFLREILSFEGESRIGLRVEGRPPDGSVFAIARLDGCEALAVARVFEAELDEEADRALRLVYMLEQDLALTRDVLLGRSAAPSANRSSAGQSRWERSHHQRARGVESSWRHRSEVIQVRMRGWVRSSTGATWA